MKRLKLGLFNVGASVCVLQQVALKDNLFNDNLYFKCGHSQSKHFNKLVFFRFHICILDHFPQAIRTTDIQLMQK